MERFTISIDDDLARDFDAWIAARGYDNRSEAIRDVLRAHLAQVREREDADGLCVANLSYVYNTTTSAICPSAWPACSTTTMSCTWPPPTCTWTMSSA